MIKVTADLLDLAQQMINISTAPYNRMYPREVLAQGLGGEVSEYTAAFVRDTAAQWGLVSEVQPEVAEEEAQPEAHAEVKPKRNRK